jgi:ABC-type phosphate transport system ATPase subunit
VSFWYSEKQALKDISIDLYRNELTAFIGPSGCGKSTLLRCLNRTNDIIPDIRTDGRILLDGADINAPDVDPPPLLGSDLAGLRRSPTHFLGPFAPTSLTEQNSGA